MSRPGFRLFREIATAWVLCPGRRTITRIFRHSDQRRAHDAYHRFFRDGAWSLTWIWRALFRLLLATLCQEGVVELIIDDTLFHKAGRTIEGAGIFRDPVRSTAKQVVYALGLNLVVVSLKVEPPWRGEPLALPVHVRLHRKDGPSLLDLAEQMIRDLAAWAPERSFHLVGDGAYASLAGRQLPRTHITSRLRKDAALYALPGPRQLGQRGRPRKKGERLPGLPELARQARYWQEHEVPYRGRTHRRLLHACTVLWYEVLKDQPVLLVIVRDPSGKDPDDFLFTTDLSAPPAAVPACYASRWATEDTFRATKQILRGESPQVRKRHAPERAAAFSFWLYSAVWTWYLTTVGTARSWIPTPWYPAKTTPSFDDALATLRTVLWRHRIFGTSGPAPLNPEISALLIDILARAA